MFGGRRVRWVGLAALLAMGVAGAPSPASVARDLGPLPGVPVAVEVPLDAVDSIVTDDAAQRVYLASSTTNAIAAIGYDGTVLSTNAMLGPSSLTINGGRLYAVQTALGRIVEISTTSLAPTVVLSGLNEPMGLAFNGANIVTTVSNPLNGTSSVWEFQGAQLVRVQNPTWGGLPPFNRIRRLFSFPEVPGQLYGTDGNVTYRTGSNQTVTGPAGTDMVVMADGRMFIGSDGLGAAASAVDPLTLAFAGTSWTTAPNWGYLYFRGSAASPDVVVQHRADSAFDDLHNVELRLMTAAEPTRELRRFEFQSLGGTVVVTKDSSRVLFLEKTSGRQRLRLFPGVAVPSAPAAPSAGAAGRGAAPSAPATTTPRVAPPVTGEPPVRLRLVESLWFDPTTGLALVADSGNGVVGIFGPGGRPLRSVSGLNGVRGFASLGGSVYAHTWSGTKIYRIDVRNGTSAVACAAPGSTERMVAAGGRLWFLTQPSGQGPFQMVGIDPATCDRADLANAPVGAGVRFSDPVGDSFFVGRFRFNASARTFTSVTGPGFVSVLANGTFIADTGERIDFTTGSASGVVYPIEEQFDVSTVTPVRIASRYGVTGAIVSIFQYESPGTRLHRFLSTRPYLLQRLAIRPGTTELWVAALNVDTDEVHVGPFADLTSGSLLDPDLQPRPAGWPAVLNPRLAATEIAAFEPLAASAAPNPDPVRTSGASSGSLSPAAPASGGSAVGPATSSTPPDNTIAVVSDTRAVSASDVSGGTITTQTSAAIPVAAAPPSPGEPVVTRPAPTTTRTRTRARASRPPTSVSQPRRTVSRGRATR